MKTEKDIKDYIEFLEDYLKSDEIDDENIKKVKLKLEVLKWVAN